MKAEVLGLGCNKCNRLADLTREAIDELGVPCSLEKVTDIIRMLELGPKALPALAIDGLVVVAGHLPTLDEIKQLLIRCAEFQTNEDSVNSSSSRCFTPLPLVSLVATRQYREATTAKSVDRYPGRVLISRNGCDRLDLALDHAAGHQQET